MDVKRARSICTRLAYLERFYEGATMDERIFIRSIVNNMFDESDRKFAEKEEE